MITPLAPMDDEKLAYSYVRLSTPEQTRGDGLKRQIESAEAYAKEAGLELVSDRQLQDIGLSAYSGANLEEGALGLFLEMVKDGIVKKGSVLIVESLDRISRQRINQALSVFLAIVNGGVTIVTLSDRHTYTAGNLELIDLIVSLTIMSRGHEESVIKSQRVSAAWKRKRQNIHNRKLTAICPAWLRLVDENKFEIDENRANTVRKIYEYSRSGLGSYAIAKRLNQEGVKPFGKARSWGASFVSKILQNRAVLGVFQPHRLIDKKRVPDGDPIPGYFPGIISEAEFLEVQAGRSARRIGGGGRKGPTYANLFTGLAVCGYCGTKMHYANKGKTPKGGTYLICSGIGRGICDSGNGWRYDRFEISFLTFVSEIDLKSVLSDNKSESQVNGLRKRTQELRGSIEILQGKENKILDLYLQEQLESKAVSARLQAIQLEIGQREQEQSEVAQKLDTLESARVNREIARSEIGALVSQARKPSSEPFVVRSKIANRLKTIIRRIHVYPHGSAPMANRFIDYLKGLNDQEIDPIEREKIVAENAGAIIHH